MCVAGRLGNVGTVDMKASDTPVVLVDHGTIVDLSGKRLGFVVNRRLKRVLRGGLVYRAVGNLLSGLGDGSRVLNPVMSSLVSIPLGR